MRDEFLATEMESMAGWVEDCQHEISFDLDDDDLVLYLLILTSQIIWCRNALWISFVVDQLHYNYIIVEPQIM